MLKIRLTRVGKKNSPAYRVVVADEKRAVKGKFIEIIGNYNPTLKPKTLVIKKERALFWMGNGAQASDTVNNLMVDLGILKKDSKVNKVYGKKFSKKAIKNGDDKATEAPAENTTEEAAVEESEEIETPVVDSEAVSEEIAEEPKTEEIAAADDVLETDTTEEK